MAQYSVRRYWGKETKLIVDGAIVEFLKHIKTGFETESHAVKFPFEGGSASGK